MLHHNITLTSYQHVLPLLIPPVASLFQTAIAEEKEDLFELFNHCCDQFPPLESVTDSDLIPCMPKKEDSQSSPKWASSSESDLGEPREDDSP